MNQDNMLIVCRSCSRKTLMHNMRPDATGDNMICIDCARKAAGITSATLRPAGMKPSTSVSKSNEKPIKYLCTSCKYKFTRKPTQEVSKCPYCGKFTIVVDANLGAEKLINDSMNKRFETW